MLAQLYCIQGLIQVGGGAMYIVPMHCCLLHVLLYCCLLRALFCIRSWRVTLTGRLLSSPLAQAPSSTKPMLCTTCTVALVCFLARCCLLLAAVLRRRWLVALGRRIHAPPPQHMCFQTQILGLVHCIVAACSFSPPELAYCSQPSVPCPSLAGPQLHTKKP